MKSHDIVGKLPHAPHMSMFANNALLGGGVRVRVWIREQRSKDQRHY